MTQWQSWVSFFTVKLRLVVEFLTSQGITMAGNLCYGFLCVRLLPISEYAKFVVVFGSLSTVSVLMDISFSSALLPLVGERTDDLRLIADYVASLRQLARQLFWILLPVVGIAYPLMVHKQHWSASIVALMVAIILVAAWCARVAGAYGAVLIVRRDRAIWYRVQMIASLSTLALLGCAWRLGIFNGLCAILINVAGIMFTAWAFYLRAGRLLGVWGIASQQKRKTIVDYAAPNFSNTIFYAFQGQISLLLITWFGHMTAVASLGALGRLGQIFILLSQMTPLLIEPYFAKLPTKRLKVDYIILLAIATLAFGIVTAVARIFPEAFLWILGYKYATLRYEVFILMAVSSISYLSGMIWVVHNARRFVYWWSGISFIILSIVIQVLCIWKTDLSTVRGVLTMNLWTASAGLLVNLTTGIYGFVRGPRRMVDASNTVVENTYA